MDFNTYTAQGGFSCRAAEILSTHMKYLDTEGPKRYSIGFIEFKSKHTPRPGDMVVYIPGKEAFVMSREEFEEKYA